MLDWDKGKKQDIITKADYIQSMGREMDSICEMLSEESQLFNEKNFFEKIQKIINAHSESSIVIGRESYLFIFLCTKTDSTMCIFCYIICDIAANILIFLIYTMVLTVYFLKFSSLFLLFHENLPKIRQKN